MNKFVNHYVGEKGQKYFFERFNNSFNFGRAYQRRYFLPYCYKDTVLLDYGCGDGTLLEHLPAKKKIGIEINPECNKKITEKNIYLNIPIAVYNNIESICDETIDIVISNHCLEHVPNPLETLKEIRRVLRQNGTFVLVVPFDDWRSRKNGIWSLNDRDYHLYTWSPLNIGNLLSEAGFRINNIKLCTFAWNPKFFWIQRYFGDFLFQISCYIFASIKNRREIFCLVHK
jgi:SAM-dependent methyltransferase